MRYDEFCDRWREALRAAGVVSHFDRPEESINLASMARRWKVHLIPRAAEPFHAGATIDFLWDPLESARSYTTEEDLLGALLGREGRRSMRPRTEPREVRVDIELVAALAYGSTAPLPEPGVWLPWLGSTKARLDSALAATPPRRRRGITSWCGEVEAAGGTSPAGVFALHELSVRAFESLTIPRIWDDPERREREASKKSGLQSLAQRFRAAVEVWAASVRELAGWIRCDPGPSGPASRRDGPECSLYGDDEPRWIN